MRLREAVRVRQLTAENAIYFLASSFQTPGIHNTKKTPGWKRQGQAPLDRGVGGTKSGKSTLNPKSLQVWVHKQGGGNATHTLGASACPHFHFMEGGTHIGQHPKP